MTPELPAYARVALDDGSRWWLAHSSWQETADAAACAIAAPGQLDAEVLLKAATRRLVFTAEGIEAGSSIVVKAFPLDGFRARLKHWKYAPSEAANLAEAARRGVPVPALYGWGERRRAGLVRWNAVLMERITGRTFTELAAAKVDAPAAGSDSAVAVSSSAWLDRSARLLATMFTGGCNHIDLKPGTLLFGANAADDRVIDFQYCSFGDPSVTTFMAQLGHFAYWWDRALNPPEDLVEAWFQVVLDHADIPVEARASAQETFADYRLRVRSIAERLVQ
ncbi:MAG: hypothetical protein AAGE43_09935 [Pseudomonadota bacterium]